MDVDRGRNYYSCRGFGHIAKHCRNRRTGNRIGEGRKLEYGGSKRQGRVEEENGEQDLIFLN